MLAQVVHKAVIKVDTGNIVEAPSTKNLTELGTFLDLADHYRRFIKSLAEISAVLNAATLVERDFEWTTGMQEDLEDPKKKLRCQQLSHTRTLRPPS